MGEFTYSVKLTGEISLRSKTPITDEDIKRVEQHLKPVLMYDDRKLQVFAMPGKKR